MTERNRDSEIKDFHPKREEFARFLAFYRTKRNLSKVEIAKALEVSPATLTWWEQGLRVPRSRQHVEKLASMFNLQREESSRFLRSAGFSSLPPVPKAQTELCDLLQRCQSIIDNPKVNPLHLSRLKRMIEDAVTLTEELIARDDRPKKIQPDERTGQI